MIKGRNTRNPGLRPLRFMGIPKDKGDKAAYLRKGLTAFLGTIAGLAVTLCATLVFGKDAGLLGQTGNENILFQLRNLPKYICQNSIIGNCSQDWVFSCLVCSFWKYL
ncbi:hypothetical protein [Desulfobacter postgatei]|uniref:Uncharacterized protein n=1 Tax=Desulfobacter postgatei 2ac9 TaxID=879212 RepID=I5B3J9_9BACT|nr:hypothetical protein [Desulfobacter postgatei]EIM64062.1 hypothetical protein DespoDRAFT_02178 [Desulfobacter postgatei 2ac9]